MKYLITFLLVLNQISWADSAGSEAILENSFNESKISRWFNGPVFASAVSGDTVYFGAGGTIKVIQRDTKDEKIFRWHEVSSLETSGVIKDLSITGEYLFAADASGYFRSIDIQDPGNLKELSSIKLNTEVKSMRVIDGKAYIASGWSGIHVIDIKEPEKPVLLARIYTDGYALDLDVESNVAIVAHGSGRGVKLFNISDLKNPKELCHIAITGSAAGVDSRDGLAYIVNLDDEKPGLTIVNIKNPEQPKTLGFLPYIYGAERVIVDEKYAYLAGVANDAGLIVVDVSNPERPVKLGSYTHPTCSESVSVSGGVAYLAHGDMGLEIIDLSNMNNPVVVSHFDAVGRGRGVDFNGNFAFLANGYTGLSVLDLSVENKSPDLIGTFRSYRAMDVKVQDDLAYLADDWAGVRILDIADPANIKELSTFNTPGYAEALSVAGDLMVVADGDSGLRVVDISDSSAPQELGSLNSKGYSYDVSVRGKIAYLADGKGGLRLIDISNPLALTEVGIYRPEARSRLDVRDVSIIGGYAFVAGGYDGVTILDVTNPAKPIELNHFPTVKSAIGIEISSGKAYVADSNVIRVLDISTPKHPVEMRSHQLPANASRIRFSGGRLFVAAMEAGLVVLEN